MSALLQTVMARMPTRLHSSDSAKVNLLFSEFDTQCAVIRVLPRSDSCTRSANEALR
jgi:hypothetical protein